MNWFSGPSAGLFSAEAHNGFGPPPASGFAMRSPFEAATSTRTLLAFERHRVAGLQDRPLRGARVEVDVSPLLVRWLDEVATIETSADRHELRQLLKPARVVCVKVTEHEVIDLLQPRLL